MASNKKHVRRFCGVKSGVAGQGGRALFWCVFKEARVDEAHEKKISRNRKKAWRFPGVCKIQFRGEVRDLHTSPWKGR